MRSTDWIPGVRQMAGKVFELQGYAIVLDKVVFLTRVFEAEDGEGYQFNIRAWRPGSRPGTKPTCSAACC
jgi:hypothetical protein